MASTLVLNTVAAWSPTRTLGVVAHALGPVDGRAESPTRIPLIVPENFGRSRSRLRYGTYQFGCERSGVAPEAGVTESETGGATPAGASCASALPRSEKRCPTAKEKKPTTRSAPAASPTLILFFGGGFKSSGPICRNSLWRGFIIASSSTGQTEVWNGIMKFTRERVPCRLGC